MAASSSLYNFLLSLPPSKLTPPTPSLSSSTLLSLSSSSSSSSSLSSLSKTTTATPILSLTLKNRDRLVPITPNKHHSSSDFLLAVCPSLAFANTLFFKSAYNVQIIVGENEPDENLISRFRREVLKAGVIQESKRRRFFETKQEERKRKTREAAKRNRKRRPQAKAPQQDKKGCAKKKDDDDEEDKDNWEFIDVDLPYQ